MVEPWLSVVTFVHDDQDASPSDFIACVRAWAGPRIKEICIYDATTDGRAQPLAEAEGLKVRRGYWDHEVGRARNEAMTLAHGQWVLVLDIDDTPAGDAGELCGKLRKAEADILTVETHAEGQVRRLGRLLRRGSATYVASESEFTNSAFTPARTYGHLSREEFTIMQAPRRPDAARKAPRRLARLARELGAAPAGAAEHQARARFARECLLVGDVAQAVDEYEQLLTAHRMTPSSDAWILAGLEQYVDLLIGQGDLDRASAVLDVLEAGPNPSTASWLRIHWHLANGEVDTALAMLRTQEVPQPSCAPPLPGDCVVRLRYRVAGAANSPHDVLTALLALMTMGLEIAGQGKPLLRLWGRRSPQDLADVIASTGTTHIDAIADELQRTSQVGSRVAHYLRKQQRRFRSAAVVIARDESRCIERCVRSVLPWVDEVVVADTGSSDDTAELAEAAGARVIHIPWTDDFSAARNAALEAAGADWHVSIDADEILTGGGAELLNLAAVAPEMVYTVNVSNAFTLAGESEIAVERITRILPGHVRFVGKIHELAAHDLEVVPAPVTIEHDGYEPAQLEAKLARREALLRSALAANPSDDYLRYQLGRNLETQGRLAEAVDEYARVNRERVAHEGWHHILVVQYAHTLTSLGLHAEALDVLAEYAQQYDASPDFHFVSGNVLLNITSSEPSLARELLPQAAQQFQRCLDLGEQSHLVGHVLGRGGRLAAHNLEVVRDCCLGLDIPLACTSNAEAPAEDPVVDVQTTEAAGGDGAPMGILDVAMIVKNEEENLERTLRSLESLRPLLGDVCVYDTGSTDGTRELARSLGANVFEGYWDDNYSRARNAAAAMSDAEWLLVVDADEAVEADPGALAEELRKADEANREYLSVEVTPDVTLVGAGQQWMSPRLYRPDLVHYSRPVHAELRRRDGSTLPPTQDLAPTAIRITNYGVDPARLKRSSERSLHLTDLALADDAAAPDADRLAALVDRARARWGAGQAEEALEDLRIAAAMPATTNYWIWAQQMLADFQIATERLDEVAQTLSVLKGCRVQDPYTAWVEARLLLAQGYAQRASHLLWRLGDVANAVGLTVPSEEILGVALHAAIAAQDHAAAVLAAQRLAAVRGGDPELDSKAARLKTLLASDGASREA